MKPVQPKRKINNYELFPKCGDAKIIMHQNMASHYRRMYNVKPRVDSGLKPSQKKPHNCWNKRYSAPLPPTQTLRLSLSSTNCSEKACSSKEFQRRHPHLMRVDKQSSTKGYRPSWASGNESNKYQTSYPSSKYPTPPPSSKYPTTSPSSTRQSANPQFSIPVLTWTSSEDSITNCKESSSSASAEEEIGAWSGCDSRDPSPDAENHEVRKSSDDFMYVNFVRGITEEVLRKGDYSNNSLREIFQKHVDANKRCLSLRRMQGEVDRLKIELGIQNGNHSQLNLSDGPITDKKVGNQSPSDDELWEALSHLNLSPSLRADIVYSLGLDSTPAYSATTSLRQRSIENCSSGRSTRQNNVRASFSKSLEVIFDGRQRLEMLPDSDDGSSCYETIVGSSRQDTPLGLLW